MESFYISDIEKALSAPSYYLQRDEASAESEGISGLFQDSFGQEDSANEEELEDFYFPEEEQEAQAELTEAAEQ